MSQWGFYFNQDRCIGCKTCLTACRNWNTERRGDAKMYVSPEISTYEVAENVQEPGAYFIDASTGKTNYAKYRQYNMKESWRRVETIEEGAVTCDPITGVYSSTLDRRYISVACNHCDNPACVKVCPMGCISKDKETGVVLVQNSSCISCGRCQDACPWGAPQYYANNYREYAINDSLRPKMTKCTMCLDRINENLRPACVAACWNRALDAGPIDDLKRKYASEKLEDFNSDYVDGLGINTGPNIIFKKKR